MRRLKRSRDAIVRALQALRQHGFLDWLRRYVPTGNEGRGPQVQQTSNAYRLSLPARALRLLGRFAHPAPAPDDHSHAQEVRAAELDAHRATLSLEQRALFDVDDDALGQALARLGPMEDDDGDGARFDSLQRVLQRTLSYINLVVKRRVDDGFQLVASAS